MSKQPSEATQIRRLKQALRKSEIDAQAFRDRLTEARHKLNAAELDAAEWKGRFDALLAKCKELTV